MKIFDLIDVENKQFDSNQGYPRNSCKQLNVPEITFVQLYQY